MRKNRTKGSLDYFKKKCRENELKITPQRVGIYEKLAESRQHPSTESVFRLVREKFPRISMDTVNRTLLTFSKLGLINVVEASGGPRRHDADLSPHHHFHCVSCNEIIDFHEKKYDELAIPDKIKKKCTVFNKRFVITGLCEKCAKSPKTSERPRRF